LTIKYSRPRLGLFLCQRNSYQTMLRIGKNGQIQTFTIMKKILIACLAVFCLFSCTKQDDDPTPPTLVGQWKLTQVLLDPGDGSGVFKDVTRGKTLTFANDGKVGSSSPLCDMNSLLTVAGDGTYDSSFIFPNDCQIDGIKLSYEIKGENLIVYYPCIEGCAEKYIKVDASIE